MIVLHEKVKLHEWKCPRTDDQRAQHLDGSRETAFLLRHPTRVSHKVLFFVQEPSQVGQNHPFAKYVQAPVLS